MDRRRFLRRALFGAGIVASGGGIDLLELIERPRRYWPGADFGDVYGRPSITVLDYLCRTLAEHGFITLRLNDGGTL